MIRRALLALLCILSIAAPAYAANGALSWPDVAGETGYIVQGCSGPLPACAAVDPTWVEIGRTLAGITTFAETGLPTNTRLCRRVTPFNGFGNADASAISCDSGNIPGTVTGTIIWTISP